VTDKIKRLEDLEKENLVQFIRFTTVLDTFTFFIFLVINLFEGNLNVVISVSIAIVFSYSTYVLFQKNRKPSIFATMKLAFYSLLFWYLLMVSSAMALWSYSFILFSFIAFGGKKSVISSLIFSFVAAIILVFDFNIGSPYTTEFKIRFLAVFVMLSFLTYFYDKIKVTSYRQLEIRSRQIEEEKERANQHAKRAEIATEAKSNFLANISHEIRTPMNGVLGMTRLLLETDLNNEQEEYAELVKRSSESLVVIINDILDYSKIEAGKMSVENIDYDLITFIEDVEKTFAIRLSSSSVAINTQIDSAVPRLLIGDPGRVRQILNNLLGNAVKFTPTGAITLSVTVADKKLVFSVADTGIGIARDKLSELFERFTQADTSSTRKYGGTGLGLSISKSLVDLLGGTMEVESKINEGTTFTFSIPLVESKKGRLGLQLTSITIGKTLLVESNSSDRSVLSHMLNYWDISHSSCCSLKDFFLEMRRTEFKTVVIDSALLDDHYDSVSDKIMSEFSDVKFILTSSNGKRGDAKRSKMAGYSAFLSKPIERDVLYDAIAHVNSQNSSQEKELITRHSINEERKNRKHILVVDDNKINSIFAKKVLHKLGYDVETAENGVIALEKLKERSFSLIQLL